METELAVVGAGPCGIAVGAAAVREGIGTTLFDRGGIAHSISAYPPYMTFFSTAERLEIENVPFPVPGGKPTRQDALNYYRGVVRYFGLTVRSWEGIEAIEPRTGGGFLLRTRARNGGSTIVGAGSVAIATGSFEEPNRLGVPGEDLPKVSHRWFEAHPWADRDVLVVGGGNSAVEAALELFRVGARTTLVHFRDQLDRGVKPWIRPDIENRLAKGEIQVFWNTRIAEIRSDSVVLRPELDGDPREIPNDQVFALTGWRPDHGFLRGCGIRIDPGTGVPGHDPDTMATEVPGLYIAGVVAAGNDANRIFIENGREHGRRIVRDLLRLRGAR